MEDCIFCQIVRNESPSYKFYEDDGYIGILSIHPLNKGHGLIIPKEHDRWVWDHKNIGKYFEVVQKNVQAMKKAFETDFVIGAQVGDEVHHAHVQLIPRYENDGHGDFIDGSIKQKFSVEEMNEFAQMIHENL